jgi:Na+-driven multidrug efflux pump
MRVALLMLPLNGFTIVSSNLFVVTGRPKISIVLSMMRQFIILIPCILIFGRIWQLYGIVSAAPVADGIAFLLTGTLIIFELRKLNRQKKEMNIAV